MSNKDAYRIERLASLNTDSVNMGVKTKSIRNGYPRITDSDTLQIPGIGGGRSSNLDRGRLNTISLDLLLFNLRLQVSAQLATF